MTRLTRLLQPDYSELTFWKAVGWGAAWIAGGASFVFGLLWSGA